MFPIPWNFPFRKKNGDITTISNVIGGGGGSDIPSHTSADAGKVLTVGDDGSLEWNEKGAGGGNSFLSCDFTKWGNRDIYEVLYSEAGAVFKNSSGRVRIYESTSYLTDFTLYIDTGDLHINNTASNHQRFLMGGTANGLIFEKTNHVWGIYNGNTWEYSEISDATYFDNCTIKLYVDANNVWHIYKNGVLVIEGVTGFGSTSFLIGASEYSIRNAVLYGARLYNGDYTET